MELNVRGLNFDLTDAILGHVRRRLHEGLSHYAPRVRGVVVRVSDVNGPGRRGPADKRCHLEVTAAGAAAAGSVFVVDEVHADLYRAVDRAVSRLRRQLAREFGRRRDARLGRRASASGLPT